MTLSIALTSLPDQESAKTLSQSLLESRLAACVSMIPGVQSTYWWEGRLEQSAEVLLLIKFPQALLSQLESHLLRVHPYDVPEFVVLPSTYASAAYEGWAHSVCTGTLQK
ncbi:MAG: divalent-cation tolerance protein CutA [Bdellovibrionota bacterium]|nr:MAG: divalent-cation tolerance protein CutA [Bdellovibrionota bacterium]